MYLTFLLQGCLTQPSTTQPATVASLTQWPHSYKHTVTWDLRYRGKFRHSLVAGINEWEAVIWVLSFSLTVSCQGQRHHSLETFAILTAQVFSLPQGLALAWIVAQLPPNSQLNITHWVCAWWRKPSLAKGLKSLDICMPIFPSISLLLISLFFFPR